MDKRRSLLSRLVRRIILVLYRWKGWTLVGAPPPDLKKFVIAGAPHTSNWDFVFFVGATHRLGLKPSFMGKRQLFTWPMTRFMLDMGGIPVDRSKRSRYVEQVAEEYARRDELALVIAVEGSRTTNGEWRSGFYHIARAAEVPIVPAWVNNETMELGFGPPFEPSGDYAADLAWFAEFYREKLPGNPRFDALAAQVVRLKEEAGNA